MAEVDARGEEGKGRRLSPAVLVGFLGKNEAKTGSRRVANEVDFIVRTWVDDVLIELQKGGNAILAVVFG